MKKGKVSAIIILAILFILFLSNPYSLNEIRIIQEGQTHYDLGTARNMSALTLYVGGYLNLTIHLIAQSNGECGNFSRIIFFAITLDAKLLKNENVLLSIRSLNGRVFYAFLVEKNRGINAEPWEEDYNGGIVTQTWAPRTIYNGFSTYSQRITIYTEAYIRVIGGEMIRFSARILGNGLENAIDVSF